MPGPASFDFNIPLPTSLLQLIEAGLAAERLSAGEGRSNQKPKFGKLSVHNFFATLVPTFQLITHTEKVFRSVSESLFGAPMYFHEYVKWCGGEAKCNSRSGFIKANQHLIDWGLVSLSGSSAGRST